MAKYGKWVGLGLGWALGGPIGGVLGLVFGSMFDGMQSGKYAYDGGAHPYGPAAGQTRTRPGDFAASLVVLAAAVMKADGKVLKVKTSVDQIGKGLAACVESKIKRWTFPKVGKPVTVAKRWVFG